MTPSAPPAFVAIYGRRRAKRVFDDGMCTDNPHSLRRTPSRDLPWVRDFNRIDATLSCAGNTARGMGWSLEVASAAAPLRKMT